MSGRISGSAGRGLIALVAVLLALTMLPATALAAGSRPLVIETGDGNSGSAVETPYLRYPYTLAPQAWEDRFYNRGIVISPEPRGPVDEDGIPMWRWRDGHLYYKVGRLAGAAMKQLDSWVLSGDQANLDRALQLATKLRELADVGRGAWWMPFEFDYPQEHLEAPWYNAHAQGLVLSLFVRLYEKTGDPVHLDAAREVFEGFAMLGKVEHPWVSYVTRDGHLWFEHYPSGLPDHVLSAHIFSIISIHEYWQLTGDPTAQALVEGGLRTVRDKLHLFRRPGEPSFYCLYHRTHWPKKHWHVVVNLRTLALISGDSWFARAADRFEADEPVPEGYEPW